MLPTETNVGQPCTGLLRVTIHNGANYDTLIIFNPLTFECDAVSGKSCHLRIAGFNDDCSIINCHHEEQNLRTLEALHYLRCSFMSRRIVTDNWQVFLAIK